MCRTFCTVLWLFTFALVESACCQQDSLSEKKKEAIIRMFRESATEGKLKYRVSLNKDTFLLYEPVIAEIWVTNISQDTVRVVNPIYNDWDIQDEAGKNYPAKLSTYAYAQRLMPGDSLGGFIGIQYHGVRMPPPYPSENFPIGRYEATYRVEGFNRTFVFHVMDPKGEEAEALKLYLDAFEPYWGKQSSHASPKQKVELAKEEVRRLQQVADRYPRSVYAIAALRGAVGAAWNAAGDGESAYRIIHGMLKEFPENYWENVFLLRVHYMGKGDTTGFKVELDSIIKAKSHLLLTATAKQELKKLETKR